MMPEFPLSGKSALNDLIRKTDCGYMNSLQKCYNYIISVNVCLFVFFSLSVLAT